MGVVKSQPVLGAPERLSSRYGGVPVIFVESDEDNYVFGECWFKEQLSRVEFRSAASHCGGFAGCNAVLRAVGEERSAGNPAWGIVDRDAVMSQDRWDLVHETDDDLFEKAKPFGPEIKTLRRWEMESYLADVGAMEKCRAEIKMDQARPVPVVQDELLDHCQILVPHAAFNALCHTYKMDAVGDGWVTRFPSRAAIDAAISTQQLPRISPVALDATEEYAQQVAKVDAFDAPGSPSGLRVDGLLRRVHGKALLMRFSCVHGINTDIKGLLANRIKEMSRIPLELVSFVEAVAASNNV